MADRKLLSTDAINLKAKVKAEMLRRCRSGSVAAYGGAAYDFTVAPTKNGPVKGEHLKKILEPMQAVNPDGLPTYPGEITEAQQIALENKIMQWSRRSITDRSATDCKSGCTGTCYSGCTTGCYTGCSSCSGCDGCDGCDGGCEGCGSGCASSCEGCDGCRGCGSGCASSCDGGCRTSCTGDCAGSCKGNCGDGCAGCSAACKTSCTGCSGECGESCWHAW